MVVSEVQIHFSSVSYLLCLCNISPKLHGMEIGTLLSLLFLELIDSNLDN